MTGESLEDENGDLVAVVEKGLDGLSEARHHIIAGTKLKAQRS